MCFCDVIIEILCYIIINDRIFVICIDNFTFYKNSFVANDANSCIRLINFGF